MVKALGTAVQCVLAAVLGYVVLDTVKGELAVGDTVGITTQGRADHTHVVTEILMDVIIMCNQVGILTVLVG